jgi:outer membrane immunogenic protein
MGMKRFVLAAAIAAFCATVAHSADLPRAYTKAPAIAPVYSWTGFYAGLNVGYGFNDPTASFTPNDPLVNGLFLVLPPISYNVQGIQGGGQVGYNWLVSPSWLFGLEADFQGTGIKGSGLVNAASGNPFIFSAQQNVEWYGTMRARAGWVPTDKLLLFATGGFAYGSVRDNVSFQTVGGGPAGTGGGVSFNCFLANSNCFVGNQAKIQTGYTAGGGLEYAAWRNVSFKVEYLYVNLGSSDRTVSAAVLNTPGTAPASFNAHFSDLDFHVVRAGINWHF